MEIQPFSYRRFHSFHEKPRFNKKRGFLFIIRNHTCLETIIVVTTTIHDKKHDSHRYEKSFSFFMKSLNSIIKTKKRETIEQRLFLIDFFKRN